jgi:hypothetical protein
LVEIAPIGDKFFVFFTSASAIGAARANVYQLAWPCMSPTGLVPVEKGIGN